MLCSVMSKPSEVAWNAALGMLKWLSENKDCGAVYRTDLRRMPMGGIGGIFNLYFILKLLTLNS